MGASSRSPSPITTVPRMLRKLNALRMASTAAWSASFSSPRPITRADAMAAASVSRTASRPMFLSMVLSFQRAEQPLPSAGGPGGLPHADVHGVPEREEVLRRRRLRALARLAPPDPVHLVFESDL